MNTTLQISGGKLMSDRAWMPLYIGDYRADTAHLSTIEHGAYLLLIMHYWRNGGVPKDDGALARITGMSGKQWASHKNAILSFFDDDLNHKRIDIERQKAIGISEKRRSVGALGGKAKSLKNNDGVLANATILLEQKARQSQSQSQSHKDIGGTARSQRATRLPNDWKLPDDYRKAALEKGLSESEIEKQAERMLNWSLSAKNGVKLDWYRTWLNWIADAPRSGSTQKPAERDLRNVPDNLLSNEQYWAKRRQLREA